MGGREYGEGHAICKPHGCMEGFARCFQNALLCRDGRIHCSTNSWIGALNCMLRKYGVSLKIRDAFSLKQVLKLVKFKWYVSTFLRITTHLLTFMTKVFSSSHH
jgi:hypothetical protein